jgi:ankyrin repeat protein
VEVVQELISKRANINAIESRNGDSVLHFAVRNGNSKAVRELLASNANADYANKLGDV